MLHILKNPSVAEYAVGAQKKKTESESKAQFVWNFNLINSYRSKKEWEEIIFLETKGVFTRPVNRIPHVDMNQLTLALEITSSFHLRLQIVYVGRFLSCQRKQEDFFFPCSKNI